MNTYVGSFRPAIIPDCRLAVAGRGTAAGFLRRVPFLIAAFTLAASPAFAAPTATPAPPGAREERVTELQNLRWGMFVCWSFSTFSGREWTPGVTNLAMFNPTGCDTDQWVKTAKEAGMGYILFLTKHHDGFCLWDTKTTDRKVTKTKLGRDVLAELRKSCDQYGIKLALYFSEGEFDDNRLYHPGGYTPELKKAQLRELLTQYGPIEYIWFDHAQTDGGLSHAETFAFCKSLQPDCFVGFNNGEQSDADIRLGEMGRPGPLNDHSAAGPHQKNPEGKNYRLAEFTYPILPKHEGGAMWFYSLPRHDQLCLSAEKLYADYLGAVKYGNIFSIDVGPDYAGKLREVDVQTLRKVGEMIRARSPLPAGSSQLVDDAVDWPAFLGRQDPVWETLPTRFDDGAFLGNGLLGATIYRDGENRIRWEMGRADVTEHRRDNNRLPIGGLVLETSGKIVDGTLRLDLWNAEVRGEVKTGQGRIKFRTLIHADAMAMILELDADAGEKAARFEWSAGHGQDKVNIRQFKDPPNLAAVTESINGLPVCIQPRYAGGEFATAFLDATVAGQRRLVLSIADSFPANSARQEVVAAVQKVAAADPGQLVAAHRDWWHSLYPKSFVSIPDPKLESFYWIQIYKLACASRPGRVPVDLLGPWFRDTGWPRIWWNLNIQTLYLPVYTANQLDLGVSLIQLFDDKRTNFVRNAREIWGFDDCATVSHTTDYEGLRGDGSRAPQGLINPGDFTWALQDYWLYYRCSMDHALITNQSEHAFYPLLRGSINLYLRLLKKGDDGRLHLPVLFSPEYGEDRDNNYNLSLLRWGCQTLIELNRRYPIHDPLVPKWREVLDTLAPYPVDENGLRIGAGVAFTKSHRHWSHMLMVHPLHIMDLDQPENRSLIGKSIQHWLTVDGSRGVYGWSRAAAASLQAALGDGDSAIDSIHRHLADQRFVRPNTMYIEGDPVIECSIVLDRSLQDMLLQSHDDLIRVFPAVPGAWKEVVFHNLRAEGAFLVSAGRKAGKTRWVRVKSLAGEPCRIKPSLDGEINATVPLKNLGNGRYELTLDEGQEAMLYTGDQPPHPVVEPLVSSSGEKNPFGVKHKNLSFGLPEKASRPWGKGYEAANAFDGDGKATGSPPKEVHAQNNQLKADRP